MTSFICRSFANLLKINQTINKTEPILNQTKKTFNLIYKNYSTETTETNEKAEIVEKLSEKAEEKTTTFETNEIKQETKTPFETNEIKQEKTRMSKKELLKFHPFGLAEAHSIGTLGWQPTAETHSTLKVDGVPYNKIHIIHIKSTRNNTILTLTDHMGSILYTTSAGTVGFKNSKKSTAVAGQGAGLALCENAKRRGIKNVRVVVKGFGNGRLASIKSLQMGKLNIVSITDNTPIPLPFAKPPRPPAKRRI